MYQWWSLVSSCWTA